MELNFEGLEIQKWNIPTDRAQTEDEKKREKSWWSNFSIYHVYSQSYGHWIVKNGSCFAFSAGENKILVTIWAKYLSAPKRSYWVLSENAMVPRLCM